MYAKAAAKAGFAFIDLGLPSGTWWANTDLGAASEITTGNQYAWGEAQPKTQFSPNNYAHYDATKGYADLGHDIAYSPYDVATNQLGSLTSLPSLAQYAELFKYTTQVRDTVDGSIVTRYVGPNGNSIILYSAAWTSTENALQFAYMGTPGSTAFTSKYSGCCIRPVRRINAFDANGVRLGVTADSAPGLEEAVARIRREYPQGALVLDADTLDYISSAGLRVLMRLLKAEGSLAVRNASPEVYDVFEMTGLAQMMDVRRRLREVSLEGLEYLARGGNGEVWRVDDETGEEIELE